MPLLFNILFTLYLLLFFFAVVQETTFAMVFSLICVFLVACFLVIYLGFEFLGYLILIVYVGAIAVLFLFMVMLFDRAEYKIFNISGSRSNRIFAVLVSFIIAFLIVSNLSYFISADLNKPDFSSEQIRNLKSIFYCLDPVNMKYVDKLFGAHVEVKYPIHITDIQLIGFQLYTDFWISLIIAGFGLLVAMIGCIILTRLSPLVKKNHKNQQIENQLSRFKL
jgi:NADH-quinone oxidoreductase subunit J